MKNVKIHVFFVPLIQEIPSGILLDIKNEKRRREVITGEYLLQYALKELYGIKLADVRRDKTRKGKPYLPDHPDIHYNISHSGDYVACAIGGQPVGMDVQQHRPADLAKLSRQTLSKEEYEIWKRAQDPVSQFYDFWVKKESYLKWTGDGITKDLCSLKMQGAASVLPVPEGYSGALWTQQKIPIQCIWLKTKDLL